MRNRGVVKRARDRSRTRMGLLLAVTIIAVVSAGCGSSSNSGMIAGVFYGMGNVKTHVGGVPSSGTIRVSSPSGSFTATAGKNGRFSVTVPAGTYKVTGRSPGQTGGISSCQVHGLKVVASQTTQVAVTCVFH